MIDTYKMSWDEIFQRLKPFDEKDNIIYGIPNNGMIMTAFLHDAKVTHDPKLANMILDTVINTGMTKFKYLKEYKDKKFCAIVDAKVELEYQDKWIIFPWEHEFNNDIDHALILLQFYKKMSNEKNAEKIMRYVKENF